MKAREREEEDEFEERRREKAERREGEEDECEEEKSRVEGRDKEKCRERKRREAGRRYRGRGFGGKKEGKIGEKERMKTSAKGGQSGGRQTDSKAVLAAARQTPECIWRPLQRLQSVSGGRHVHSRVFLG
ncbi:hypothetical protein PoB_002582400 [Plakobranchus ocellatus]|uniref:Uncharacterized protein n=1 Tax=Plakobranchus ocellatus TaxID=259542 RepID=A0AAV3ZY51_9GAST|nr:hypothetical protein PoB_002582400 [Plakobranchus ocellatus]